MVFMHTSQSKNTIHNYFNRVWFTYMVGQTFLLISVGCPEAMAMRVGVISSERTKIYFFHPSWKTRIPFLKIGSDRGFQPTRFFCSKYIFPFCFPQNIFLTSTQYWPRNNNKMNTWEDIRKFGACIQDFLRWILRPKNWRSVEFESCWWNIV